ncbi:solute carrier family 41 member 1-like [Drosophila ficusphila]|uniref:solute carrier family 41 member 1-like n=1 Tax=Drosophila ficusphila TaxID=30025 RepID=UPI0007E82F99|nr:solute carrier family 41 member 1-like [Drosophila ficusphila]
MEEPAPKTPTDDPSQERWYSTLLQIGIPFFLAGLGTITAGLMLGNVQDWTVYRQVNELFVLVSVLCGLKGNLDMCVASRICTHSNLGHLSSRKAVLQIVVGNMALVQLQAIVCAVLLSSLTVGISALVNREFSLKHYFVLTAAALITSSSSCFFLDSIVMVVVLFSQRYSFNPDYMAIPLVASIGDMVTISLLSYSAATLYDLCRDYWWLCVCLAVGYLVVMLLVWLVVVLRNVYVRPILMVSWIPVIGALCISQIAGFVLCSSVEDFRGFAIFSPIINGIGGNLVSVQASHMGSVLYQRSSLGTLPEDCRILEWPHRVYLRGTVYSRVVRILIGISVPGNVGLVLLADYLYMSHVSVKWTFVVAFVLTSLLQLLVLLWLAHALVHLLWRRRIDPDTAAIPYLTAVGDALGTGLLAVMFHLLRLANKEYEPNALPWLKIRYLK